MTFRCPHCGVPRHPGGVFCLECGEPLDDAPPPDGEREAAPARRPAGILRRPEVLGGIALLCGLAALILISQWRGNQDRQGAAYARGLAAQTGQDWPTAIAAFRTAGAYADAPQRLQAASAFWTTLQGLDAAAARAETDGAWWDAAAALRDLAARDPQYPAVAARLAQARVHAGVIVYRIPHDPGAGLWWAQADGSNPQPFPGGANVTLHGISPDSRWAVYTVYTYVPLPPGRQALQVLDLQSGQTITLPILPVADPGDDAVRFWADGQGFWWVLGQHWSAYEYATRALTPIPDRVVAADTAHARLLIAEDGPHNSDGSTTTVLQELDKRGRRLPGVQWEMGAIEAARFSPDGRRLSFQSRSQVGGGTVDTLMLLAFDPSGLRAGGFAAEDRALMLGMHAAGAGTAPGEAFQAFFLPLGGYGEPAYVFATPGQPLRVVRDPRAPPGGERLDPAALGLGAALRPEGLDISAGGRPWAVRLALPSGAPVDWLGRDGAGMVLYLGPGPGGTLALWSAPAAAAPETGLPQGGVALLTRTPNLFAWAHNVALSGDGTRLLAIRGPIVDGGLGARPPGQPGLWAVHLDGTAPVLVVPEATEFWTPQGWLVAP